mgnify:FL=1|tara:strand:- start:14949 stop:16934 length:1986 start_codon:yes stop_codon:yes gene_type:complete
MNKRLWSPSEDRIQQSNIAAFIHFIAEHFGYPSTRLDYPELHAWSLANKELFWKALWLFAEVQGDMGKPILDNGDKMPGASWFPQASLNFAHNLLKPSVPDKHIAIIERGEHGRREQLTYGELREHVSKIRQFLISKGVAKGDCVAGFLPNSQYAIIAMLATASIGAIWTSCSPDFGINGVLDRFQQTQPKVLLACDGYYYANKTICSLARIDAICESLESLSACVIIRYLNEEDQTPVTDKPLWQDLLAGSAPMLTFEPMAFNDPLYVMYSSGTTGKPKCIIHTIGGTLLQHIKELSLHTDVKQSSHLFYYTTCGWMMWNWLVSGLSLGARIIVYDGSPFHKDKTRLFDLIDEEKITIFGASAKYYAACEKFELVPKETHQLDSLKTLLSTGSPLSQESFQYIYDLVKSDVCVSSISGGTDIISCFALGCPVLPVYQGELQCIGLGMDVEFVDDHGKALSEGKGELVCRQAFPSMPSGFWNDPGDKKYTNAYFTRFEHCWAHGDYGEIITHKDSNNKLTQAGVMIHGRSDAVLNPGGVRIGTAEIYRQVEKVPEVFESIAIGQTWKNDVRIILFVTLKENITLNDALITKIKESIRQHTTPRHVPSKVIQVSDIPRTLSGKIVELAVKKTIEGQAVNNTEALANPEALNLYKNIPALKED